MSNSQDVQKLKEESIWGQEKTGLLAHRNTPDDGQSRYDQPAHRSSLSLSIIREAEAKKGFNDAKRKREK